MAKLAVSVTLDEANLLWLRGRAASLGSGGVGAFTLQTLRGSQGASHGEVAVGPRGHALAVSEMRSVSAQDIDGGGRMS